MDYQHAGDIIKKLQEETEVNPTTEITRDEQLAEINRLLLEKDRLQTEKYIEEKIKPFLEDSVNKIVQETLTHFVFINKDELEKIKESEKLEEETDAEKELALLRDYIKEDLYANISAMLALLNENNIEEARRTANMILQEVLRV